MRRRTTSALASAGSHARTAPPRHRCAARITTGKMNWSDLQQPGHRVHQPPAEQPCPSGSAIAMTMRQLAEQQRRHLGAREAEHAQAGQLPGALGQRDARVVVDHADGDHAGEQR